MGAACLVILPRPSGFQQPRLRRSIQSGQWGAGQPPPCPLALGSQAKPQHSSQQEPQDKPVTLLSQGPDGYVGEAGSPGEQGDQGAKVGSLAKVASGKSGRVPTAPWPSPCLEHGFWGVTWPRSPARRGLPLHTRREPWVPCPGGPWVLTLKGVWGALLQGVGSARAQGFTSSCLTREHVSQLRQLCGARMTSATSPPSCQASQGLPVKGSQAPGGFCPLRSPEVSLCPCLHPFPGCPGHWRNGGVGTGQEQPRMTPIHSPAGARSCQQPRPAPGIPPALQTCGGACAPAPPGSCSTASVQRT